MQALILPLKEKVLHKQLSILKEHRPDGVQIIMEQTNDVTEWTLSLDGPSDSPFEGRRFVFKMNFEDDYPFRPPKVNFITKIFHPGVD